MLHSDEINELLESPVRDTVMDEATEIELRYTVKALANAMGDSFQDFGMQLLLSMKNEILRDGRPGDAAYDTLTEYLLLH